jgi:multiple sugar transport system substrate-binding protein
MKIAKKVVSVFLVGLIGLSLTACSNAKDEGKTVQDGAEVTSGAADDGGSSQTEQSGSITVLSFSEYHDAVEASINAYMDANPNVTVKLEEYPYSQYSDAVEIKLGSQSSDFDVILTDATMVSSYAYKGWITSLDNYYSADEKNEFVSALVKSGTYDDQFYSPPLCNSCQVLWYNKDLLDAAEVSYPSEEPQERLTWEEVVDISEQVMRAANDDSIYGLTFEQVDRPYQILPLPNSMGAEAFAQDGMTVDGYLNSDSFAGAMQWYSDIHNVYKISPKGTSAADSVGLFTAGKIAFLTANIFDYATFDATENFNYGFTPFPMFQDKNAVSPTDSWHISLSSFSENKELAIDFIKYFTIGEGNDVFLETKGALAARLEILNSYESDEKYSEFPYTVFQLAAYEAKNTAYPRPSTLAYGEFESIITSTFSDIRNGSDVKEALDSAVSRLNTQMSMYQ